MNIGRFVEILGADFFTGVPDSQLKALCNYLMDKYGIDPQHHIIAANEGNCVALAAGYHLATGKVPVVYMQNSGEGNIINPIASLLHEKVYGIPVIFVIGWRGEPGIHDEPQHIYQGEVTLKLLDDMEIENMVISKDTTADELTAWLIDHREALERGRDIAFVIKKGALSYDQKVEYKNDHKATREEIIEHIVKYSGDDPIISTTGKTSRELFEIRVRNGQDHKRDFLTVGSMGHASSIALGIAINKPDRRIWCIDGDGAVLMHMGAMAVIGAVRPSNMVHILINNNAHETVGGMPTVAGKIDVPSIARACGYESVYSVSDTDELDKVFEKIIEIKGLIFIEIKAAMGAREDLGRPTTTAKENKINFMNFLTGEKKDKDILSFDDI